MHPWCSGLDDPQDPAGLVELDAITSGESRELDEVQAFGLVPYGRGHAVTMSGLG